MSNPPLITVVGQTASGKSDLAIELARRFNGEIICADSRTIYKGMDIGTAKPSRADRTNIKHHLLDVITPDKEFSAADFKDAANIAIRQISSKDRIPILVGGTGLYTSGVIYDYSFGGKKDVEYRNKLEDLSDDNLAVLATQQGIDSSDIDFKNRRHLIRAIERGGMIRNIPKLRDNTLLIGINIKSEDLKIRIKDRINKMIDAGLEEEVRNLADEYGFKVPGMNTICYKEWEGFFKNEQSIDELKQNLYRNTWQYAKRQKTWFKRDENIHWITSVEEASVKTEQFLIQ